MNRKQSKDLTNTIIIILIVFFALWIIFEVSSGYAAQPPAPVDRLGPEVETGLVCFGNPEGGDVYHPIDCDKIEVSNESPF